MTFEELYNINVNDKTEQRDNLTYLSWAWAWAEFKKRYPEATYTIWRNPEDNLPYSYDEHTGYMVYTSVTAGGLTHEMWLPVMDSKNKAMKSEPYKYSTRQGEKTVPAATMFDVNKAIMRCLTKNLAMFGLGLYIYAGEDLPEAEAEPKKDYSAMITPEQKIEILRELNRTGVGMRPLCESYGVASVDDILKDSFPEIMEKLKGKPNK